MTGVWEPYYFNEVLSSLSLSLLHTHSFQDVLSHGNRYKMFEMTEERPSYWGPFDNHSDLFSPGERKNHGIPLALQWAFIVTALYVYYDKWSSVKNEN